MSIVINFTSSSLSTMTMLESSVTTSITSPTVVPPTSYANVTPPSVTNLFCKRAVREYFPIEELFYGYFLPGLSLLGVIANIINIIVLTDRRLAARTYTYLAFLAVTDLVTLMLYFVDLSAKIHFQGYIWHEIFAAYIYLPIGSVVTTSSLMLTVTFTIDRYVCSGFFCCHFQQKKHSCFSFLGSFMFVIQRCKEVKCWSETDSLLDRSVAD